MSLLLLFTGTATAPPPPPPPPAAATFGGGRHANERERPVRRLAPILASGATGGLQLPERPKRLLNLDDEEILLLLMD